MLETGCHVPSILLNEISKKREKSDITPSISDFLAYSSFQSNFFLENKTHMKNEFLTDAYLNKELFLTMFSVPKYMISTFKVLLGNGVKKRFSKVSITPFGWGRLN